MKPKHLFSLRGTCEATLYCWVCGIVLPHANALYNLGLYGSLLLGGLYLCLNAGTELKRLPLTLTLGFVVFICWGFVSCFWAPVTKLSITEWWGNPGIAMLTAGVFGVIFQSPSSQKRFWQFFVLLSSIVATMCVIDWFSISKATGNLVPTYPTMRSWGDRLILCFPFMAFAGEKTEHNISRIFIRVLTVLLATLMIITSARGIWLALFFYIFSWAIVTSKGKTLFVITGILVLFFGLTLAIPNNPLKARIANITYTSDRVNYTWGPAMRFWKESPFFGIGYGSLAFYEKAKDLAEKDSDWLREIPQRDREQYLRLGPHSNYLEALAAGGIVGLLALLFFYAQVIRVFISAKQLSNPLLAAAATGILVKYMIHGTVESINWRASGILVGLIMAIIASTQTTKGNSHLSDIHRT